MRNSRVHGWALVIGAALLIAAQIANHVMFAGNDLVRESQHPLYVPVQLLSGLGALLWMWGLPLFAAARVRALDRRAGLATFLLVGVAAVCCIFFGLVGTVVSPFLVQKATSILAGDAPPGFFVVVILGSLACLIGSASLALALSAAPSRADGPASYAGRGRG